jgi:hypothetical protein
VPRARQALNVRAVTRSPAELLVVVANLAGRFSRI